MADLNRDQWLKDLPRMDLVDLLRLKRFAVGGHPVFCDKELYAAFNARVAQLGGFTPEVSKQVGW